MVAITEQHIFFNIFRPKCCKVTKVMSRPVVSWSLNEVTENNRYTDIFVLIYIILLEFM